MNRPVFSDLLAPSLALPWRRLGVLVTTQPGPWYKNKTTNYCKQVEVQGSKATSGCRTMAGRRLRLQHTAKIYTQEGRVTTQIPPSAASLHAFSTPQSYSSSQATPPLASKMHV